MGDADNYLIAGDILLVRGKEMHRKRREWLRWLISAAISSLTGSEYTHAAMYVGNGAIIDVDVGRRVAMRPISELDCFDAFRVVGATNADRLGAVSFCWRQIDKRYDYLAVAAIAYERLTGRVWPLAREDPHRWFCSEMDDSAWKLSSEPGRVTPGDLATNPKVQRVHQSTDELVALF
ncbi:hypothetical protein [Tumebacillus flagellatus]|uniref:Uncharacterized protein n=1 Tax=Tumebacillus flagellatus TaxID=1157490 RepID=A0A074LXC6_9BACL|nr:hypothetical protein [Tumebacillus flagellatus]KEO84743.1 hypothetical protein EL26_01670 [Tumebacillus flagellatus]